VIADAGAVGADRTPLLPCCRPAPACCWWTAAGGAPPASTVDGSGRSPSPTRGPPPWRRARRRDAVIVFTAAQDGRARGARLSHRNLARTCAPRWRRCGSAGTTAWRGAPADPRLRADGHDERAARGGRDACCRSSASTRCGCWTMLRAERITVIAGVPAIFGRWSPRPSARRAPEHALRVAICGGAPLPGGGAARGRSVRRAAARGVRAHRGRARLPVQPDRPAEPPRHARLPVPRRGGHRPRRAGRASCRRRRGRRDLRPRRERVPRLPRRGWRRPELPRLAADGRPRPRRPSGS
jgi:hypothetical protein